MLSEDAAAQAIRKSYVHGVSNVPLLFDTVGDRLRMAVDQVHINFFESGWPRKFHEDFRIFASLVEHDQLLSKI